MKNNKCLQKVKPSGDHLKFTSSADLISRRAAGFFSWLLSVDQPAVNGVSPHDGERGHVQSHPGAGLQLGLVQLEPENTPEHQNPQAAMAPTALWSEKQAARSFHTEQF